MVLELGPATEADADEIASLHVLSFDSNVLLHAQFPTPASLQGLHKFLSQDAAQDLQDPGKALIVVRDTETNRIVSFAKWHLPGQVKYHADLTWPDGCQQQYLDEYYEQAEAAKKRVVGDTPCYFLTFVGTHPDYRGRGAGTMLTEWGLARAKSENIPVYLDSTVPASRIYLKLGLVAVDGLKMTLPGMGKDGGTHIYEEVSMLWTWGKKTAGSAGGVLEDVECTKEEADGHQ